MTASVLTRRRVLTLSAAAVAAGGYLAWSNARRTIADGATQLSVEDAHASAATGEVLLIDIRTPGEWQSTGIGEGALPLDMRRDDFIDALNAATGGDTSKPVALICARGVRSARMTRRLTDAGYTNLIDVPEGMLGSRAGPGWLAKGLPVTPAS